MVQVSYPGVYVVEKASGVRTITGVATSITAFIGRASRGPVNDPIRIQNYSDYDRTFGGLSLDSTMSYAVQQFFQNGGSDALIVRVYAVGAPPPADGIAVSAALASGAVAASGTLTLAANPSDADTMTIGGKAYTFDAHPSVAAQGTLTVATIPTDGDTMTIGGKVYTFQTVLTDTDGNIAIGTLTGTRLNIVAAINVTTPPGTQYAASTVQHPTVSAAVVGTNVVLTARTPGTAGNSIPTVEAFTAVGNVFDAATLGTTTPGVDALPNTDGHILVGANVAATQANIVAAVNLTGTPGTQYAAATTLHPTVSAAIVGPNLVFTAKTTGPAGNAIATTETFTAAGNVFGAATLAGGVNATPCGPVLEAASPGRWGSRLRVRIDHQTRDPSDTNVFNLEIREINPNLPATSPPFSPRCSATYRVTPLAAVGRQGSREPVKTGARADPVGQPARPGGRCTLSPAAATAWRSATTISRLRLWKAQKRASGRCKGPISSTCSASPR